jgi:hypothetical protein
MQHGFCCPAKRTKKNPVERIRFIGDQLSKSKKQNNPFTFLRFGYVLPGFSVLECAVFEG